MGGGDTLKPKCFKEADLPKQRLASNAIWAQRKIQDEVTEELERLLVESLYSCISWNVSFPIGNSQKADIRAYILIGNWRSRNSARRAGFKLKSCLIS
jgi:hypothetical protein